MGMEARTMKKRQWICFAAAAVCALGLMVMTGCGKEESAKVEAETTTTAETTTETTTEETTKEKTYQDMYGEKLDGLIDEYGSVNCGRLIDLDGDDTPEMIVFRGSAPSFAVDIYTIDDGKAVSIYEKSFSGLRYWQSDASYEVWINESISPTTLVLFDSSDEWKEDVVYAITMEDGAISTKTLKAVAKGEPDTPDWSECKCTINEGSVSASDYEVERSDLQTGADELNPASSDVDSLRSELSQ